MWRLADGQHGRDQIVQRPVQVVLGDQGNLVIDAKMVDGPSRNRAVGRQSGPGPVRRVPPTGRHRWTRRCPPSGAAWCRPGRSGSPRPSSAQFVSLPHSGRQTTTTAAACGHARAVTRPVDCRRRDRARLNPTARAIDLANHGTEGRPDNSVTSSPRRRTANRKKTPIPYGLESRSHVRGQHADLPLTCGGLWSVYRRCCRAAGPRLGCGGGTAQSSCRPGPAFAGSPR